MPELMGSFFALKVIILLCLTVFLGNYSVFKKYVFNGGLKVRSVICYGVGGLQICTIAVPCKYYRCCIDLT